MEAHTPVNMQSVVALPPPRPLFGRLAAPVGVALVLAAAAIAAFAYLDQRGAVRAEPVVAPTVVQAPAPAPEPAPAPAPLAAPSPEPAPAPAPAAAPEPAPKKKKAVAKKKARKRRGSRSRTAPKPTPAAPEAPTVVKKSDLKGWE